MAGEPRFYLLIKSAVSPTHEIRPGERDLPFWDLKQKLRLWLLDRQIAQEWQFARTLVRSAAQGYPSGQNGVDWETSKRTAASALEEANAYAKSLMPWRDFEATDVEDIRQMELKRALPALIEAWYRYFDPDNLPENLGGAQDE